jgi:hypothetical protein
MKYPLKSDLAQPTPGLYIHSDIYSLILRWLGWLALGSGFQ